MEYFKTKILSATLYLDIKS